VSTSIEHRFDRIFARLDRLLAMLVLMMIVTVGLGMANLFLSFQVLLRL
jgi:hypothetical protein